MDAYLAMGDNFDEHCLDYSDAEDPSSGSSRVSGGYHDWSFPDAGYSSPVASAVPPALGRNVVATAEGLRGRRLNDKLYALRSVVPNITKMDKVSIIKDAVEYVQRLQEEERRMLAEISILESAAPAATHGQRGAPAAVSPDSCAHHAVPPMKKMRSFVPSSSGVTPGASAMAAASRRVEDLEVRVTGAGDRVLLVSVACRHRKDAIAKVCLALDGLGLPIISSNVTSASGKLKHTALVQGGEMHQSEMKQVIETAISQVDAFRSTLSSTTMCY